MTQDQQEHLEKVLSPDRLKMIYELQSQFESLYGVYLDPYEVFLFCQLVRDILWRKMAARVPGVNKMFRLIDTDDQGYRTCWMDRGGVQFYFLALPNDIGYKGVYAYRLLPPPTLILPAPAPQIQEDRKVTNVPWWRRLLQLFGRNS